MSNHLFRDLNPPPGRRANLEGIASYWQKVDADVKQAQANAETARKQAAKLPDDHHYATQLTQAEDTLLGVQGDAKMARRRIVEGVERGHEPWTVEAPMTPEQQLDAEERAEWLAQDDERVHGLEGPSAVERELRATQRKLRRER